MDKKKVGRPKGIKKKSMTFRLPLDLTKKLDQEESKTLIVELALKNFFVKKRGRQVNGV